MCPCVCVTQVEELLKESLTLSQCVSRAARGGGLAAGVLEKLLPKRAKQYAKGERALFTPCITACTALLGMQTAAVCDVRVVQAWQ